MNNLPILVVGFKRPNLMRQVLERIKEAEADRIYIFVDHERSNNEIEKYHVDAVKALVRKFESDFGHDTKIQLFFPEENMGVSKGPASAISWFFSNEEMGIILEDDCVPDLTFFNFAKVCLEKYKDRVDVGMIQGFNPFPINRGDSIHFFSKYSLCWGGFATWRNRWLGFDLNMKNWPEVNNENTLKKIHIDSYKNYLFWRELFRMVYIHPEYGWDTQWTYYLMLNKLYSVVPGVNLLDNIGYDDELATSTKFKKPIHIVQAGIGYMTKSESEFFDIDYHDYDLKVQNIHYNIGYFVSIQRFMRYFLEQWYFGKLIVNIMILLKRKWC